MRLILSLLMLGIGATSWAQSLSSQQALQRALSSQEYGSSATMMKAAPKHSQFKLILTDDAAEPAYYVFAPASGQGYLVVSGDEAVAPVLGYSDNGVLDPENLPSNMASWLAQYAEQVEWARTNGTIYKLKPNEVDNRAPIAPLCQTKWNQDKPYNNLCPRWEGYSSNCVTGCVATSMAQIMKYYNYPESAKINANYTYNGITVSDNVDYTFGWGDMLDSYSDADGYTETQAKAVAELMYAAGLSVKMEYGPKGSGADETNIPGAMVNDFGYDQNVFTALQKFHDAKEWEQMVYDQLRNVGPVEYNGTSNYGGHSFICDGYDKNGYFHINWGWGGLSDGYFLLTALVPSSQGIGGSAGGYNYNNAITGGIQLPGATYIYKEVDATQFTLEAGTYAYGTSMPYSFDYVYNMNAVCPEIHLGFKLVNTDNNEVIYKKIPDIEPLTEMECGHGLWTKPGTVGSIALAKDVPNGNYLIYPAWCDEKDNWYPMYVPTNSDQYHNLIINEAGWTICTGEINVDAFKGPNTHILGDKYTVTLTVSNPTPFDVTDHFIVVPCEDYSIRAISNETIDVSLGAYETATLDYTLTFDWQTEDPLPKEYNFFLTTLSYTIVGGPILVTVKEPEENSRIQLILDSIEYGSMENNKVYLTWDEESPVSLTLTNTNAFAGTGRYRYALHVYDQASNNIYSTIAAYSPWYEVYLDAGEKKEISTTFVINESTSANLPESGLYYLVVIDDNFVPSNWNWLSDWGNLAYLAFANNPVTEIILSATSLDLNLGETYDLGVELMPEDADDPACSIYSSDESVVKVEGITLTAVGVGEATVTVASGNATATCKVQVKDPNSLVSGKNDDLEMRLEGRTLHISSPTEIPLNITTVGGISKRISLKAGANSYTFTAPGLYIVGNRKVIVK